MDFQQISKTLLTLGLGLVVLVGCASSGSDDDDARDAFDSSDVVIDSGSLDELEYEVRSSAVQFRNPTPYDATFIQYNAGSQTVDVHSIRKENLAEVFQSLGSNTDGTETHRFVHADAVTGEIRFKGEYSMISSAIDLIRATLQGTDSALDATICFLVRSDGKTDSASLKNSAESCFDELNLSVEKYGAVLNEIGELALAATTTATKKTIKLKN